MISSWDQQAGLKLYGRFASGGKEGQIRDLHLLARLDREQGAKNNYGS
jgi:hypothetical protein